MYLSITILITCVILTNAESKNSCETLSACNQCISNPGCAWCYDTINVNTTERCFSPHNFPPGLNNCDYSKMYNPDTEMIILSHKQLSIKQNNADTPDGGFGSSQSSSSSDDTIIHIKPQKIRIKLRPKETVKFQMDYAETDDFSLDVYYLVNTGASMKGYKEKLQNLGNLMVAQLKKVTENLQLGFGTAVTPVTEDMDSSCQDCPTTYTFKNEMTLSDRTSRFSQFMENIEIFNKSDVPEMELDAIMQTVVCRHFIGWRENARRLVVFAPDGGFQKTEQLESNLKPNTGECHLDRNGYFKKPSNEADPNLSQINTLIKDNQIRVIFTVQPDKIDLCEKLSQHIEKSTCSQLSSDSSNVVDLIENEYNRISSTVEMKDNATDAVKIRFFSKCLDKSGPEVETNKCSGLKVGDVVQFLVKLEVLECPTDPRDQKQIIHIYPVGVNASLEVDLTMLCECPF